MKRIVWSIEKNHILKHHPKRNICFEDIVVAFETGGLLDDIKHPNKDKYPDQRIFVVFCKNYVYAVPYMENEKEIFLKTIFPSRRLKNIYLT